jgi:hypothetical protein
MPYVRRPFNPLMPTPNQVVNELNQANENFEILANAFQGGDPTTGVVLNAINSRNADTVDGFHASLTPAPNVIVPLNASGVLDLSGTYIKSNVYTFRRVDLTGATSDYLLQVGEEAIIRFTNATSVSLRIALVNDAVYEFFCPSIPQGSLLYPNNTAFSSQFISFRLYVYWTGSSYAVGYDGNTASGFYFFAEINRVLIINDLTAKRILASYGDVPGRHIGISGSFWNNTTTPWTSLGTISFSWPLSGFILVRRLV